MCLTNGILTRLTEDTVVYKYLVYWNKENSGEYCSPHCSFWWRLGNTYKPIGRCIIANGSYRCNIYGGAFHSYEKLEDAVAEAVKYKKNEGPSLYVAVAECVIPKDAVVYKGNDNSTKIPAYASSALTLTKIAYKDSDIATLGECL